MTSEIVSIYNGSNPGIPWDQSSQYAPTPGFWDRGSATPSVISTDQHPGDDLPVSETSLAQADRLPLLDFADWSEGNAYDEQPPLYPLLD